MTTSAKEELLDLSWLNGRQAYDEHARNSRVMQECLRYFAQGQRAESFPVGTVVDLGAGTGNNALHLLQNVLVPEKLILIEQHPKLLEEAKRRFIELAETGVISEHYCAIVSESDSTLSLQLNGDNASSQKLNLEFVCADFRRWLSTHDAIDLITCGALLDLLTHDELISLLESVKSAAVPFYSSLNYLSTRYDPPGKDDSFSIELFESHMTRSLDRGFPLGSRASDLLIQWAEGCQGYSVLSGRSDWTIASDDESFLTMNLEFHYRGAHTMCASKMDRSRVEQWYAGKRRAIREGLVGLGVQHHDHLLLPD